MCGSLLRGPLLVIKACLILWIKCDILNHSYDHFVNGYLLGYSNENIICFLKKNLDINIDDKDIRKFILYFKNHCDNLEYIDSDLDKCEHKIVLKKIIKEI